MSDRPKVVSKSRRPGFTLLELAVVAGILVILSASLVPFVTRHAGEARDTAARASLATIRDAIAGSAAGPGFQDDTAGIPPGAIRDLINNPFPSTNPLSVFNRETQLGWRGPYLLNVNGRYTIDNARGFIAAYGFDGDPALIDPWGNPVVLQRPTSGTVEVNNQFIRLISAGPNGRIDTPQDYAGTPYPPASARGDDIVLFINHADSP